MVKANKKTRRAKRNVRSNDNQTMVQSNKMSVLRGVVYNPSNPGRAVLRGTVELFNGVSHLVFSYTDFANWCGSARGMLTPFAYFRVVDAQVTVRIAGGSASANTVVFNISNSAGWDTDSVAILNDEYSAMANGTLMPTIRVPASYWKQGGRTWYNSIDPTGTVPSAVDTNAGTISLFTAGAPVTTPATVAGWAVVDMCIEFHTLL